MIPNSPGPWFPPGGHTRAHEGFDPPPDGPKFSVDARRGFRLWYAQADGRLKSVSYAWFWQSGWNRAECLRSARYADPKQCAERLHPETPHRHGDECPKMPGCPHPSLGCQCGFYAYFGREYWTSHRTSKVITTGVIEAMGRLVIGSKGFRAEKALIVALCMPQDEAIAELVKQRYPNAAFFDDEDEMLAKVPLSPPPPKTGQPPQHGID